ncbi:MAG TPA: hypothetical protein VEX35_13600 [Allosphingosinicella sp.]|nr:hypothetical protein [Allosphingosinicella sp.]
MMPQDFPEYAALWREQIDPKELAELQAMATKIRRSAGRKLLFDRVATPIAIGGACLLMLRYSAPPLIRLSLALVALILLWYFWRRYQITKDARAIAFDDPRVFFEAAIENMRAEVGLSTLSAWLGMPMFVAGVVLAGASGGPDNLYEHLRDVFTQSYAKTICAAVVVVLLYVFLIRDNIRLREQLRRLEAMRREWEERDPGDEP